MVQVRVPPSGYFEEIAAGSIPSDSPTFWVLPGSAAADPDGSLGSPFPTLQAAWDEISALALSSAALLCFGGDLGSLEIDDLEDLPNLIIIGLASATGIDGRNRFANIQTILVSSTGLQQVALSLVNVRVENVVTVDVTSDLAIFASGVRVLGWECALALRTQFEACVFATSTLQTQIVRFSGCCHWESGVQINSNASAMVFDVASWRDSQRNCFLPNSGETVSVDGDTSYREILTDADASFTEAIDALVMTTSTLSANRSLTLVGAMGTPKCWTFDVMPQDFDLAFIDDDSSATLYTLTTPFRAVRLVFRGTGVDATVELVSVQYFLPP